ncbi:hypothetical protein RRG08_063482 [Elysia crispata]|uniref:Uncharacterized protein n=1 Tax=Elysia crispata TaxID=231223 RepID=A0AAE1AB75_9GAST|nr:hypothetical protein RRG08_063482 [Elysia crispata]
MSILLVLSVPPTLAILSKQTVKHKSHYRRSQALFRPPILKQCEDQGSHKTRPDNITINIVQLWVQIQRHDQRKPLPFWDAGTTPSPSDGEVEVLHSPLEYHSVSSRVLPLSRVSPVTVAAVSSSSRSKPNISRLISSSSVLYGSVTLVTKDNFVTSVCGEIPTCGASLLKLFPMLAGGMSVELSLEEKPCASRRNVCRVISGGEALC